MKSKGKPQKDYVKKDDAERAGFTDPSTSEENVYL